MSDPKRIAVVYGGVSGEHEVSIRSAQSVMAALRQAGYEVVPVYIGKDGIWRLGGVPMVGPRAGLLGLPEESGTDPTDKSDRGASVTNGKGSHSPGMGRVDVVFPVLHGTLGEDGTLQGLLEVAEVPYVGSGVLGSALGMDKIVMKMLFRQAGLPVVDSVATGRRQIARDVTAVADEVEAKLGYPCFVKPANLGSSVGISKAHGRKELLQGLAEAARYDRRVIVERGIEARELEVSVIGNDEPEASVVGEVIPGREFYDYVAKYGDSGSQTIIPAPVSEELAGRVRCLALEAFRVLDLAGMARVDFLLDRLSGQLYVNEVNTIPGFTDISMFAKLWEASGLDFPCLVSRLVELGWERFEDRQRSLEAVRDGGRLPDGGSAVAGLTPGERRDCPT
ncbi:MAG: D-alanine--D-alanine ligase [Anaerolineae bacterium]|nr:D-alanine--D-alanine ligase [Anaerolineae bacterium]